VKSHERPSGSSRSRGCSRTGSSRSRGGRSRTGSSRSRGQGLRRTGERAGAYGSAPQKSYRPPIPSRIARWTSVGGYPKNSDNYPNTSGVLNAFKYKIRAQRDSEALCK
jgi:hypothetical protein